MKGSWDFMPIEVASKTYQFLPSEVVMRPIFCYNFLHELESLWWLATWMLFFHHPEPLVNAMESFQRGGTGMKLFPSYCHSKPSVINRTRYICQSGRFERILADLHVDLRPYGNKLDKLRTSLLEAYSNYEARLAGLGEEEVSDGIYNDFRLTFQAMTKELESKDVPLIRMYNTIRLYL